MKLRGMAACGSSEAGLIPPAVRNVGGAVRKGASGTLYHPLIVLGFAPGPRDKADAYTLRWPRCPSG